MTISQRIILGFALLLTITSIVGGLNAWQMHTAKTGARFLADAVAPQTALTSTLHDASNNAQLATRTYSLTGDPAQLALAETSLHAVQKHLVEGRQLAEAQPALTQLAASIKEAETALNAYQRGVEATSRNLADLAQTRTTLDASAQHFMTAISDLIKEQDDLLAQEIAQGLSAAPLEERRHKLSLANSIRDAGNAIRIANFKSQALRDQQWVEKAMPLFTTIEKNHAELKTLTRKDTHLRQLEEVRLAASSYRQGVNTIIQTMTDSTRITKERVQAAEAFDAVASHVLEISVQRTSDYATTSATSLRRSSLMALLSIPLAALVGAGISIIIIRRLNRTLRTTASGLSEGALQIAAASGQVAATSQTLAQGASEQAASLEEISASLEQLTHTTAHNAGNAAQAKTAADEARAAAELGAGEMRKMQEAMAGIHQSSAAISKIIKTIDEIAFQTNILALNAAVEAARAGEAGAGFAVVADEVRTLAQRCAVAARETTDKISDASTRSEQGAKLTTSVSASLTAIVAKSREVDRLVAEVAGASHDQSQGLQQVTAAITQMDQVTQSNAAAAEESASAAEELNAQAADLSHASAELSALVGLSAARAQTGPRPTKRTPLSAPISEAAPLPARTAELSRKPAATAA